MGAIGARRAIYDAGDRVRIIDSWMEGQSGEIIYDVYSTSMLAHVRLDSGHIVIIRASCLEVARDGA